MTPSRCDAPWHSESYDRFLHERLPALLAERLPLLRAGALQERRQQPPTDSPRHPEVALELGGR